MAIQSILELANRALTRIYQTCDLGITSWVDEENTAGMPTMGEAMHVLSTAEVQSGADPRLVWSHMQSSGEIAHEDYLSRFGPDDETGAAPENPVQLSITPKVSDDPNLMDRPAQTLEELLQKLNLISDMAATTPKDISPSRTILPAVKALHLDLAKLRGAG